MSRPVSGDLADHRKLGRRGQRRADEGAETEDQRSIGSERIEAGPGLAVQQPGRQTDAAEKTAQHLGREWHKVGLSSSQINSQIPAVIAKHAPTLWKYKTDPQITRINTD